MTRYAIRTLAKTPGFTAVAIGTIALGIAANTAIFSIVNAVLLQPLPFRDEARVARIWTTAANGKRGSHSAGNFLDLQTANRTLTAIAGYREGLSAVGP